MKARRRSRAEGTACLLAVITASILLAACGGSQLKIVVLAPEDTNDGRPVYMLVRKVDEATFVSEPYPVVAAKVVAPDATVLEQIIVYPGFEANLKVDKPEKGSVGIYFFFTRPAAAWRMLVPQPLDGCVELRLGKDRIEAQ
ncbi:hypothetical protein [Sorangium sp. So ce1099]|uniref:hypothetical protein n=1 Tax=Sorangium sp. So ce1099 TaxID=3133331 RepID=UPI003F60B5D3